MAPGRCNDGLYLRARRIDLGSSWCTARCSRSRVAKTKGRFQVALPDHATAAAAAQPLGRFRERAGGTVRWEMTNQDEASWFCEASLASMRRGNNEEAVRRHLLARIQPHSSGLTIRGYNDLVLRAGRGAHDRALYRSRPVATTGYMPRPYHGSTKTDLVASLASLSREWQEQRGGLQGALPDDATAKASGATSPNCPPQ
jgi:hypothetical protein